MGYTYIGDSRVKQIYLGNARITKGYLGDKLIFSASNPVTYHIDVKNNLSETIEVDYGASVLDYTPTAPSSWGSSWKFVGWREDTQAPVSSEYVLKNKTMGTEPITLYAVFKQDIVRHFISFDTNYTTESVWGTRYYNNGNIVNPAIKVPTGKLCEGWTWRGWSAGGAKSGNATVALNNGDVMKNVTSSGTHYGLYYLTERVTVSYKGNGATSGSVASETKDRYWSASGAYVNPTFTLKNNSFTKSNYNFSRWAISSTSGTKYNVGNTVTLSTNTIFYAMWIAATFSTDWFDIHGHGNDEWDNAVETESAVTTLIPIIDLTGFSTITLAVYDFKSSDGIENNNNKGARARIKLDNITIIELITHDKDDHNTNTSDASNATTGSYNCASVTGNHAIKHCYYNMDGDCEAKDCKVTFTSSGTEV